MECFTALDRQALALGTMDLPIRVKVRVRVRVSLGTMGLADQPEVTQLGA